MCGVAEGSIQQLPGANRNPDRRADGVLELVVVAGRPVAGECARDEPGVGERVPDVPDFRALHPALGTEVKSQGGRLAVRPRQSSGSQLRTAEVAGYDAHSIYEVCCFDRSQYRSPTRTGRLAVVIVPGRAVRQPDRPDVVSSIMHLAPLSLREREGRVDACSRLGYRQES